MDWIKGEDITKGAGVGSGLGLGADKEDQTGSQDGSRCQPVESVLDGAGSLLEVSKDCRGDEAAEIMQIDWMNRDELAQAIPWAYTRYIGGYAMAALGLAP